MIFQNLAKLHNMEIAG